MKFVTGMLKNDTFHKGNSLQASGKSARRKKLNYNIPSRWQRQTTGEHVSARLTFSAQTRGTRSQTPRSERAPTEVPGPSTAVGHDSDTGGKQSE